MKLIGLNDRISAIDISDIASQEILTAMKKLPDGNIVNVIKQLPENVIRQVCTQGVNEQITAYIPIAVAGLGVGLVVGFKYKSFFYGVLAASAVSAFVYLLRKPQIAY